MSPRTKHRVPAIDAWEEQRVEQFSTPIIDVPLDTWPENFPNVEQSKFLIRRGAPRADRHRPHPHRHRGGIRRHVADAAHTRFPRCFEEDITGTAIAHIDNGLFEAHARDEAGYGDLAGHNRMWFLARDIAFEHPPHRRPDGPHAGPDGDRPDARRPPTQIEHARRAAWSRRVLPDDIDFTLESWSIG